MYKLKCEQCGCEFEHYYHRKRFCDDCRKIRKAEQTKKYAGIRKLEKSKPAKASKTLSQVTAELEAYNKEHKTNIKYGEFVSMKGY